MTEWLVFTESGSYVGTITAYSAEEAEREAESLGFEVVGTRLVDTSSPEIVVID